MSRVGMYYVDGPDDQEFDPKNPDWSVFRKHEVVSDTSSVEGCVTVRNGAGQEFSVAADLIDQIAAK